MNKLESPFSARTVSSSMLSAQLLKSNPSRIDAKFLERWPEFIEFRDLSKPSAEQPQPIDAPLSTTTPEEAIELADQGIIKEDRLGLDTISIQAKPWQGSVGRTEIQKFVGALQGQRATKGVFITTSTYTADAVDYSSRIYTKVVLIDGKQLAALMIDFDVGVSASASYAVKRIDSDYFEES